jgi:dimethylaniline monooxygenase (N-oxide forming)
VISVAIVGAGLAGLAAAKAALEYNLEPTVFERASRSGGLWRPGSGFVWPALTTNISRFTCSLSDHPWPAGTPDFPTAEAVADYLVSYARRFGVARSLRLACEVVRLEPANGTWRVTSEHAGRRSSELFDAAVVASGFFGKPVIPPLAGTFNGLALHSGGYRSSAQLSNRRVVVVGMSFSGAEITAELARGGIAVTAVTPRAFWLLPKLVKSPDADNSIPLDLYRKTRSVRLRQPALPRSEQYRRRNRLLATLGQNPGQLNNELLLDPNSTDPPHVVVSDALGAAVDKGTSTLVVSGRVTRLERSAVVLADGRRLDADAIVWCTGYRPDLSFLSREVRRAVEYDPTDMLQPLLLADAVFPRGAPGLSFVGLYRGPYFGVIELQARWVCAVISGALPPPSAHKIAREVARSRQIRRSKPRPQFPYDDLAQADRIGRTLGVLPPVQPSGVDDWFWDSPVIPAHYRMLGSHNAPEVAESQIEEAISRCQGQLGGRAACRTK